MTSAKCTSCIIKRMLSLMLPVLLGACHPILDIGIDPSSKGVATACDLLHEVDVRASRKDTPETQRTLYFLQAQKDTCDASIERQGHQSNNSGGTP